MKQILFVVLISSIFACNSKVDALPNQDKSTGVNENLQSSKIPVLNFGTPDLGQASDANSSMINLSDPKEKADLKKMVEKLVKFKPTVILLELEPINNDYIKETYEKYKVDQMERLNYSDEMNSIGLEVGRLSGTKRIYGIDSQMGFGYPSLIELANRNTTDGLFVENMMTYYKKTNSLKLLEQYHEMNTEAAKMRTFDYYNFLATQHTENNYEGAKIIAEFY